MSILLENKAFCLTIGDNAIAESLVLKETGEELLRQDEDIALFSVTQERPFNNEVKLAHPNKRTVYQANRVRWQDGRLLVQFEIIPVRAVVDVKIADAYVAFSLVDFIVEESDYNHLTMDYPPVSVFRLCQLPVKNRANYGEWLNVSWDDAAAVNVLATCPTTIIDSERRKGYRVMYADCDRTIKLKNSGAAIIAAKGDKLMDAIDALEEDFDLPRGVKSRRSDIINASIFWTYNIGPDNVDEQIAMAKKGGFRLMLIYYPAMFKTEHGYGLCGDYDYSYPNGRQDLIDVLNKIKAAGITPGIHFLQTHIGLWSRYVTPKADPRLGHTRMFTLAKPIADGDTELTVLENTEGTVMHPSCRILQFGGELISYEAYTEEPPYRFTGIKRGALNTIPEAHDRGQIGGILDISEFGGTSCYIDQNTDLQDEVAAKLADAYDCGFEFIYFDGSEGTNVPFGIHVPNAQYRVWKQLKNKPLFTEGAAKAHFSWHFLSGGNAFDVFHPEIFKAMIDRFPAEEAPRMRQDFTRLNFGWWGFWNPGTQADQYEYGTSRAAAWDCPITIQTNYEVLKAHPRIDDIMEVMRRWEDVRAKKWLTAEQKEMLKQLGVEHILLINEKKEYELLPYTLLETDGAITAYVFERCGKRTVVYWHHTGEATVEVALKGELRNELYDAPTAPAAADGKSVLPAAGRRYFTTDASVDEIRAAFKAAVVK